MMCPCNPSSHYDHCCGPYHRGESIPDTAEQLMRSRYSAYALANVDYIEQTMLPPASRGFNARSSKAWAESVEWLGLTIIESKSDQVTFAARYKEDGQLVMMCERSDFKKVDGKWYYTSGQTIKPTANGPCPCGSGKKYKRCCGKLR